MSDWQQAGMALGYDVVLNRWETIILTTNGLVCRCKYAYSTTMSKGRHYFDINSNTTIKFIGYFLFEGHDTQRYLIENKTMTRFKTHM